MRLSEAIMLGSTTAPPLKNTCWRTCLIGIGLHALGKDNIGNFEAMARYPWLRHEFEIPKKLLPRFRINAKFPAKDIITWLASDVQDGTLTLEQAVDWIRSVEPPDPEVVAAETEVMRSELCEATSSGK